MLVDTESLQKLHNLVYNVTKVYRIWKKVHAVVYIIRIQNLVIYVTYLNRKDKHNYMYYQLILEFKHGNDGIWNN